MGGEAGSGQIEKYADQEAALRAHASDVAWQKIMLDSAIKFAEGAIKALSLAAGGAVVVGLAFVGSIYGTEPHLAKALVTPVFLLAASAVSATICGALAYVAQYFYAQGAMHKKYTWEHPYVEATKGRAWRVRVGGVAHFLAVLAAVASFVFIISGGLQAWSVMAR